MDKLNWLISPCSSPLFFEQYWESEVLVVNRSKEGYWDKLLTLGKIDDAICTLNFELGQIRIEKFGENVDPSSYVFQDEVVDVSKVLKYFRNGYTIILNRLNDRLRSLAELTAMMEYDLSMPFQTNIYLTPEGSQGFGTHYDSHCVFILQVSGSKHWRIYEREVLNPTHAYSPEIDREEKKTVTKEFTLHPGDMAYIPRGFVHDASTFEGGGASLHITLGVHSYSWSDFLSNHLSTLMEKNPALRESIPIGFARTDFDPDIFISAFKKICQEVNWQKWMTDSNQSFIEKFIASRQPLRHGYLEHLTKDILIDAETIFSRRPFAQYQIFESAEYLQIKGRSNQSMFPSNFKDLVQFALSAVSFTIKDLPGNMDVESKVRIIQKLVDDSWVTIIKSSDKDFSEIR